MSGVLLCVAARSSTGTSAGTNTRLIHLDKSFASSEVDAVLGQETELTLKTVGGGQ
jgi:hypothetical protein